jgi:hypothetical protein
MVLLSSATQLACSGHEVFTYSSWVICLRLDNHKCVALGPIVAHIMANILDMEHQGGGCEVWLRVAGGFVCKRRKWGGVEKLISMHLQSSRIHSRLD